MVADGSTVQENCEREEYAGKCQRRCAKRKQHPTDRDHRSKRYNCDHLHSVTNLLRQQCDRVEKVFKIIEILDQAFH